MNRVTDMRDTGSREHTARDGIPVLPLDDSRLAMMRSVKRLRVAERIALLDRMCREQTRIAIGTHKLR